MEDFRTNGRGTGYLIVAAAAFVAMVFSSGAEEFKADDLIGTWRYEDVTRIAEGTFKKNGTYTSKIIKAGVVTLEIDGKWSLEDGMILYEITKSSEPRIPAGIRDRDRILKLTEDTYIIQAVNGARREYKRVPPGEESKAGKPRKSSGSESKSDSGAR